MPACFWLPSRLLVTVQAALALLAVLALAGSGLPVQAKAGLMFFCAAWTLLCLARDSYRRGPVCRTGLRYCKTAGWELWRSDSGWRSVQILAGSLVIRQLVIVRFRYAGQRRVRSLVLPADVLPADSHRRLRLWLRFIPVCEGAAERSPVPPEAVRGNQA